jgi:iron(III) transport system permease protein
MAKAEPVGAATVSRTRALRFNWGLVIMILLIGSMGFYILYPLALILINSFNVATIADPPAYGLGAWREAFSDPGIWKSLWNTVKVAFVRQALTFPVGVLLAWIIARTNIPYSYGIEFLFWLCFMLPSLATTFGWILMLDPDTGLLNMYLKDFFGFSFNIYSFWGIIWVHFISGFDSIVILLTPAFRRMDAAFEEASRMSGANTILTMLKVTLPVMTPALVVVFILGTIRMFETFETELLLGIPWGFYVYSTKIVDLARMEPPLVNQAAALGSIILVVMAVIIPLQRMLIHRRQFTTITSQFKPKLINLGKWRYPVFAAMLLVLFLAVGVPILSTIGGSFMVRFGFFNLPKTWTTEYWQMAVNDPRLLQALKNTLIIVGSVALVGPILFSFIAYVLVRTRLKGRAILDAICWLPTAVPGVLAGLGLMWMFLGTPVFRPLYGTLFLLMIASILGGVTLATQILKANFIQLGNELEEASRMSGAGFLRTYFKIVFPLMAQTMVLIGVLKFLFAARSASSIILLATSESRTLALLALDQIAGGYREVASITVLLVIALTTGLALIARAFGLKVGIRQ